MAGAAVSRCRVRRDVSIFAGAVDEATVGRGVFTLQAQWAVINGLLRALGREAGVGAQSPQKHKEKA